MSKTKEGSEKKSEEFKGNYMDIVKGDVNAEFQKAFKDMFQLSAKEDFSLAESYLALSQEARKAYEKCLESKTGRLH